ncbi:MAG: FCD domain-containing protein, partial [Betaproteobacteria bacterium]|nr:FCD domain-containing protein [Betaproteobacteria bacterium]
DFHVRIAELMGNHVLAQILGELISRCALITLMYQSLNAAQHSAHEHEAIVEAMAKKDVELSAKLMEEHLIFVENSLSFDKKIPTHDISLALS